MQIAVVTSLGCCYPTLGSVMWNEATREIKTRLTWWRRTGRLLCWVPNRLATWKLVADLSQILQRDADYAWWPWCFLGAADRTLLSTSLRLCVCVRAWIGVYTFASCSQVSPDHCNPSLTNDSIVLSRTHYQMCENVWRHFIWPQYINL